jgi:hypothetical protein
MTGIAMASTAMASTAKAVRQRIRAMRVPRLEVVVLVVAVRFPRAGLRGTVRPRRYVVLHHHHVLAERALGELHHKVGKGMFVNLSRLVVHRTGGLVLLARDVHEDLEDRVVDVAVELHTPFDHPRREDTLRDAKLPILVG